MGEDTAAAAAVRAVFVDVLGLTEPVDWEAIRYGAVEAWDSLVHMALVAELESGCGVSLSDDDILAIGSYADALRIVAARRAGAPT